MADCIYYKNHYNYDTSKEYDLCKYRGCEISKDTDCNGCQHFLDKPYTVFVNIGPGLLATYTGRYFGTIEEAKAEIIATENRGPEKIVAKIEDIRTRTAVLIRGGKEWHQPKKK